jgi:MoxR-like ATPase
VAVKIRALFDGRFHASIDDVRQAVKPALRHRLILNFEGEAEGITTDQVLDDVLAKVPETT